MENNFSVNLNTKVPHRHDDCGVCRRIEQTRQGKNPYFVRELETGYVVIGDYQRFPGYSLFLCKEHATELHFLEPELTEEEHEIARRGRNLPIPPARRQNQAEYRHATAFETLIGWWHIHDRARLDAILNLIEEQLVF